MSDLQPIAPEAAVDLYLDQRRDELAAKTLRSHRYRLKPFVEWCEMEDITNMNDLTGRDLHAFRVWRSEEGGLAPVSLQGHLSTLRMLLEFCTSIDAVPGDLKDKVLLPTVSESEEVSDTTLDFEVAEDVLERLERYEYASRKHVIFTLLWRTGMRSGALRSLDVQDYSSDKESLDLHHRPDTDTPLKNQERGERYVALDPLLCRIIDDYLADIRENVTDDYGRDPLITTTCGRVSTSTIRQMVYRATRPCKIGHGCPHDRDPDTCTAAMPKHASKCPSSRSPHDVRSGAITAHLLDDVPVEIVSDRMDVSQKILDRHYDKRSEWDKMKQRRRILSQVDRWDEGVRGR